ncbi:hypothetical protein [Streptomyces fildesensis]|uniref:hypothetical protein n=1 Tax=Streptomyces fildesensis TaxID=375757 RepID=UPI0018DFC9CB|nr:hypothetical protein [Streptomyces fildesensis]
MTRPRTPRTLAVTAAVATVILAGGCSHDSTDDRPSPAPTHAAITTAPAGTGPYPDPTGSPTVQPLPSATTGTPHGGIPVPASVDQRDATDVSKGALTVMWTYDTALDVSTHDASVRAAVAGWLTPEYAGLLKAHKPQTDPGAQWHEWAKHRAYTTVSLARTEDAARPVDTSAHAWRQWTITTTPHGRDAWTGKPTTDVAYVELIRTADGQPWHVSAVTIQ